MLTGFFRGPPLIVHALLVALAVALLTPIIAERVPSRGVAFLVAIGLAAVYFFVALVWGSRHVLFPRRPTGSDETSGD